MLGTQLLDGLTDAIRSANLQGQIAAVPYHWPCMPYVHFTEDSQMLRDAFYAGMLQRGVLMLRDHMNYISLALTHSDIEAIILAASDVLSELGSKA
jgi:glutamate-1-semialdehyde aminotransferase